MHLTFFNQSCQISFILVCFIIFYSFEFFTPALADGFPLELEWQQVSSSPQDFSRYSRCYMTDRDLFWFIVITK